MFIEAAQEGGRGRANGESFFCCRRMGTGMDIGDIRTHNPFLLTVLVLSMRSTLVSLSTSFCCAVVFLIALAETAQAQDPTFTQTLNLSVAELSLMSFSEPTISIVSAADGDLTAGSHMLYDTHESTYSFSTNGTAKKIMASMSTALTNGTVYLYLDPPNAGNTAGTSELTTVDTDFVTDITPTAAQDIPIAYTYATDVREGLSSETVTVTFTVMAQ
jgi:hypothetical protein